MHAGARTLLHILACCAAGSKGSALLKHGFFNIPAIFRYLRAQELASSAQLGEETPVERIRHTMDFGLTYLRLTNPTASVIIYYSHPQWRESLGPSGLRSGGFILL